MVFPLAVARAAGLMESLCSADPLPSPKRNDFVTSYLCLFRHQFQVVSLRIQLMDALRSICRVNLVGGMGRSPSSSLVDPHAIVMIYSNHISNTKSAQNLLRNAFHRDERGRAGYDFDVCPSWCRN